jgi:hypothetical protein
MMNHIYNRARVESGGFFKDLNSRQWALKHAIHCNESKIDLQEGRVMSAKAKEFYRENEWNDFFFGTFEPTFTCGFERKLGSRVDGGKWVCDPHRISTGKSNCLVYSIGSNNQFDFEERIHQHLDCTIHTFDPTVDGLNAEKDVTTFHKRGFTGTNQSSENYFTIGDVLDRLGHHNTTIDIFKIDCEGCEYSVFTPTFFTEPHGQR